jgi:hypothetical protein
MTTEEIAKELEGIAMHTVGCPDDCLLCIAAARLRDYDNKTVTEREEV